MTYLLKASGKVEATVTGTRQNKRKNGLEVPCKYMLKGPKYAMDKTIVVVNDILTRTSNKT